MSAQCEQPVAIGGDLEVNTLLSAYAQGIFPWYSLGQPILWWSPDPRMVLIPSEFKLHRSLRKSLQKFAQDPACEIRIDADFDAVIRGCAQSARKGQHGTWIVPAMQRAYSNLHRAGFAHSVETWKNGKRIGGLYCVAIGKAVFGESMFSLENDASKIALAALVAMCRRENVAQIDCQQNTKHLASLGGFEISRSSFLDNIAIALKASCMGWEFNARDWQQILL